MRYLGVDGETQHTDCMNRAVTRELGGVKPASRQSGGQRSGSEPEGITPTLNPIPGQPWYYPRGYEETVLVLKVSPYTGRYREMFTRIVRITSPCTKSGWIEVCD